MGVETVEKADTPSRKGAMRVRTLADTPPRRRYTMGAKTLEKADKSDTAMGSQNPSWGRQTIQEGVQWQDR